MMNTTDPTPSRNLDHRRMSARGLGEGRAGRLGPGIRGQDPVRQARRSAEQGRDGDDRRDEPFQRAPHPQELPRRARGARSLPAGGGRRHSRPLDRPGRGQVDLYLSREAVRLSPGRGSAKRQEPQAVRGGQPDPVHHRQPVRGRATPGGPRPSPGCPRPTRRRTIRPVCSGSGAGSWPTRRAGGR